MFLSPKLKGYKKLNTKKTPAAITVLVTMYAKSQRTNMLPGDIGKGS